MSITEFIRNNKEYFEDFITRNTYHSNAIEGNTLSYADTYAIIFNDNDFKVSAKPREIYEAINHKYAIDHVLNHLDDDLTEKLIKEIAIIINKNINEISGYRKVSVRIQGAEHIPPAAFELPQKMMYFVYNYNHVEYPDIFEKIADGHIQMERIHPFEDGNGRTGRLLVNYELLKNGMAPIVIPKDERGKYFSFLSNSDSTGLSHFFKELEEKEIEHMKKFVEMQKSVSGKIEMNKVISNIQTRLNFYGELGLSELQIKENKTKDARASLTSMNEKYK